MTRFPIKDDVMQYCPKCHRVVMCARTVYPDEISFMCNPHGHRFRYKMEEINGHVPGEKPIDPPKGYGEDD